MSSSRSRATTSLFVFQSSPCQLSISTAFFLSSSNSSPPSSPQAHALVPPLSRLQHLELLYVQAQLTHLAQKEPQELLKDEERKEERRKETRREREEIERVGGRALW